MLGIYSRCRSCTFILLRFGYSEILQWTSSTVRDTEQLPDEFAGYISSQLSTFSSSIRSTCPAARILLTIPFPQDAISFESPLSRALYHVLVSSFDGDFVSDLPAVVSRLSSPPSVAFPLPSYVSVRSSLLRFSA